MAYTVLDDLTWADLAISFTGTKPDNIFLDAASAFLAELVESTGSIQPARRLTISLQKPTLDIMLYSLFEELIFIKDTRHILLHPESITLEFQSDIWSLTMILAGEKIDRTRHRIKTDIKAVTMHNLNFSIDESGLWNAIIVLDL